MRMENYQTELVDRIVIYQVLYEPYEPVNGWEVVYDLIAAEPSIGSWICRPRVGSYVYSAKSNSSVDGDGG